MLNGNYTPFLVAKFVVFHLYLVVFKQNSQNNRIVYFVMRVNFMARGIIYLLVSSRQLLSFVSMKPKIIPNAKCLFCVC